MSRIDDSHQPYKRKRSLGPGPKHADKIYETKDWECSKRPKTKKYYVQKCVYVGDGPPKKARLVKRKIRAKKVYNKIYRKWAASRKVGTGARTSTYHCRKNQRTSCK